MQEVGTCGSIAIFFGIIIGNGTRKEIRAANKSSGTKKHSLLTHQEQYKEI